MIDPIEDPLDAAARLLADHDSMLAEDDHLDRDAEVAERVVWAWGQMSIVDRCAAAIGRTLSVEVNGIGWIEGELVVVGSNWIELRTDRGADYVVTRHVEGIVGVQGASRLPEDAPKTERSHDLRQLLRRHVNEDGRLEFLRTHGSHITGRPVRVGADHVDVELLDGQSLCLPLERLALIRVV
ncbi:MAG: hypothetical protein ACOYD0_06955 [Candidatus Nanopelagicales bacterium]